MMTYTNPVKADSTNSSSAPTHEPQKNTLAERWFSTSNLGLLNFLRSTPHQAPTRDCTLRSTLYVNMLTAYFKCIVQGLLWVGIAAALLAILTFCSKFSLFYVIPLTILFSAHLAATHMHAEDNNMHQHNISIDSVSLYRNSRHSNLTSIVDQCSRDVTRFFAGGIEKLSANTIVKSILDKQMAYIPDNSKYTEKDDDNDSVALTSNQSQP